VKKKSASKLIVRYYSKLSECYCYLTRISNGGLTTHWASDSSAAMQKTRAQWERVMARYGRLGGRLVKP